MTEKGMPKKRILIVEDEAITAMYLQSLLKRKGFCTEVASRGNCVVKMALNNEYNLILMDIHLAGKMSGFDAAKAILAQKNIPIIFTTGYQDKEIYDWVKEQKNIKLLTKPMSNAIILKTIDDLIQQ